MPACPHCAAEVPDSAIACPACGGLLATLSPSPKTKPKISGHAIAALYLSLTALIVPVSIVLFSWENSHVAAYLNKLHHRTVDYYFTLLFFIALVLAAASIKASRKALTQILGSDGSLKGKGRARAGLIVGCIGFSFFLLLLAITAPFSPFAPYVDASPVGARELATIGSLRTIHSAAETYRTTYHRGFPRHLSQLGSPRPDDPPSAAGAGLIDTILTRGMKATYVYYYRVTAEDENHWPSAYTVTAIPLAGCGKGGNCYFTDETGIIRVETSRVPDKNSPQLAY